jgi:hypothetical protein
MPVTLFSLAGNLPADAINPAITITPADGVVTIYSDNSFSVTGLPAGAYILPATSGNHVFDPLVLSVGPNQTGSKTVGRSTGRIEIKISPSVTARQREDSRFIELLKHSEAFFNCSCPKCFSEGYRSRLCLHEAGHAYFARKSGASDVKFYGPTMYWDARPEYDKPAISRSAVGWTPNTASVVDEVKAYIAGYVCRREMTGTPNDKIAIGSDLDGCRKWFDRWVGTGDLGFAASVDEADSELLKDLRLPGVRREIWRTARKFEREVFGCDK